MVHFVMTFALTLDEIGYDVLIQQDLLKVKDETKDFCLENNCKNALEVSNEFVTDFLP